MLRRVMIALVVLAACDKAKSPDPLPKPEKLEAGDFPDNPLLASVSADTPYVFATFKPVPPEYIHKMVQVFGPIYRRGFDAYMAKTPNGEQDAAKLFDLIGNLDAKRFDELGLSVKARFAVYGLASGYPVVRFEIANGDRVTAFVHKVADAYHQQMPEPTQRGPWKVWRNAVPDKDYSWITAIGPKELVVSFAPPKVLDAELPTILGETKPATSLTTRQMKDLAQRDGFTGQGLGYADLQRISALADHDRTPDCRDAIAKLFAHAPRFVFGYRDLTPQQTTAGVVIELAPDTLAALKTVTGSLAGLDRVTSTHPAMVFAVAGNLNHGRALLPGLATVADDLGKRCETADLGEFADKLRTAATAPLPPVFESVHGGMLVVDKIERSGVSFSSLDGYSVIHADHAADLVKLISAKVPGLDLPLDGEAHALPATGLPVPVKAAATSDAIAIGVGADAGKVSDVLGGKPVPAPLALMIFDYQRLGELIPSDPNDPSSVDVKNLASALGELNMQISVDNRGLVMWMTFGMK